jgi:hypothetical protein
MTLNAVQVRVLGALIEKEIVTPENYPLSVNALVNACNQKSSRDPVMDLTEEQVQQALHTLEDIELIASVRDSRVAKFEHRARTIFQLRRDETAVLCLLLLRGAQTPGELRSRCERMYAFDGIDSVESTLARLTAAPETIDAQQPTTQPLRPLIAQLPRQPGSREARFAHLLSGAVESAAPARTFTSAVSSPRAETEIRVAAEILDRIAKLEAEVAELREAISRING